MPNDPDVITRRRFLRTSVLGAALSWTVPAFVDRTFLALHAEAADSAIQTPTGKDHPILVVLQLAGGNDGLNAVIPYADDLYYSSRPTLAVPKNRVVSLNHLVGFHPALTPLKGLYDDGHLAIVQGVGYPNPNRSHFRSTEIWQTGDTATMKTGWLGRYFDNCCAGEDASVGVVVGNQLPQAFTAETPTGLAVEATGNLGFGKQPDADEQQLFNTLNGLNADELNGGASIGSLSGPHESKLTAIEYLQRTALDAQVGTDRVKAVLSKIKADGSYPKNPLANSLSLVARLIAGGMPTRVYYLSQGGYDTHNAQSGTHERLMANLAGALSAFCRDLQAKNIFDRVLVMTFSEFGRRVGENASKGTDHGTAAPMFLCGGNVKPGLFAQQPSLQHLDSGDLIHTVDFRSVYATILRRWMKAADAKILGRNFPIEDFV